MANRNGTPKNLRRFTDAAQAREVGRRGGVASGRKRRELRAWKEAVLALLTDANYSKTPGLVPLEEVILSMLRSAREGNPKAAAWLRDTSEGKPTKSIREETAGAISVRWLANHS